jgi:HAD superfamily hydrolase (TIGR01458 family)
MSLREVGSRREGALAERAVPRDISRHVRRRQYAVGSGQSASVGNSRDDGTMRLRAELHGIEAFAFDLGGVLHDADRPIPGAAETVAEIRASGLAVRFVTNTTTIGRRLIAERLRGFGFEADAEEVFCPSRAAAAWLRQQQSSATLFVASGAVEDFEGVPRDERRPDVVVIGDLLDRWTFQRLNAAFRLVYETGSRLVGLGRTRYWSGPDGPQLDVGPILAALEYATGTTAVVFGKPEAAFFDELIADLALPPARVAMVGDDAITDVAAAMRSGLKGVLVRTGKFQPRDLEGPTRPDLVLGSVADMLAPDSTR